MSTDNIHILTLDSKDAFKHKLDDFGELRNNPIKPIFEEGLALAKKVVENSKESDKAQDFEKKYFSGADFNNILAFVGDRGSGKTSALLSFSKLLETASSEELNSLLKQGIQWPQFHVLEPIDPSALEGTQRIMEVIIARLYQTFLENYSKDSQNRNQNSSENVRKIMDAFNDIMRALRIIRHPSTILKESFSGKDMMLERLDELGTITQLRKRISTLVECILSIIDREHPYKSFLVIVVDDADLHLENPMHVLGCVS